MIFPFRDGTSLTSYNAGCFNYVIICLLTMQHISLLLKRWIVHCSLETFAYQEHPDIMLELKYSKSLSGCDNVRTTGG